MLCNQQQGAAADFPVVQLVVLERGGWDAQDLGELWAAQAEVLTQLAQALAASIIERGMVRLLWSVRFFMVGSFGVTNISRHEAGARE